MAATRGWLATRPLHLAAHASYLYVVVFASGPDGDGERIEIHEELGIEQDVEVVLDLTDEALRDLGWARQAPRARPQPAKRALPSVGYRITRR